MRLKLQEDNAQSCSIVVKGHGRYSWSRFITCVHAQRACEPVAKWPIMGHLQYNNNSNKYMSEYSGESYKYLFLLYKNCIWRKIPRRVVYYAVYNWEKYTVAFIHIFIILYLVRFTKRKSLKTHMRDLGDFKGHSKILLLTLLIIKYKSIFCIIMVELILNNMI